VTEVSGASESQKKAQDVKSRVSSPDKPVDKTDGPAKLDHVAAYSAKPAEPETKSSEPDFTSPEVNEPSRFPPLRPIDPINVTDAKEPIVQDLVRMLNDLITVINADKAHDRYGSTVSKAKDDVAK